MRHQKTFRKFGRQSDQRKALLRSLCTSLVKYERIETTLQKAKDLRREIEKAVTLAKKYNVIKGENDVHTKGLKASKRTLLEGYFHAAADREILGRDKIKRYLSNLSKENREAAQKYIKDPDKNPKPEFIVEYIPASCKRTIKAKDGSETSVERGMKPARSADGAKASTQPAQRILRIEGTLNKLINRIAPRFESVSGGYTRIYKLGSRRGDNAEMAIIEFTKK